MVLEHIAASASTPARTSTRRSTGSRARTAGQRMRQDPGAQFIGPACVIDVTTRSTRTRPPAHGGGIKAWDEHMGRFRRTWGCCVPGGDGGPTRDSFLNLGADGPHSPGFHAAASLMLATSATSSRRRQTVGSDAGRPRLRPGVSESHHHARHRQVRPRQPREPRSAAADRRAPTAPLKIVNGPRQPSARRRPGAGADHDRGRSPPRPAMQNRAA